MNVSSYTSEALKRIETLMRQTRDIIVIGASAGGVEALTRIVESLDPELPAAVFVVLHLPPDHMSYLPKILNRAGPLTAVNAEDNADIRYGHIYIAPPDFHLLVSGGSMHIARGPRVNRSRPAIDLLFQSASAAHGPRVIGVIASGVLDDGTRGLATIKRRDGLALVQNPDDATFKGMPCSAIQHVDVDQVLSADEIGHALNDLVAKPLQEEHLVHERPLPNILDSSGNGGSNSREISPFTCPDCNGTLWEIEEGSLVHYQCRVGHSFTPSALIASQVDEVETLLWSALRAMEERDAVYQNIASRNEKLGARMFETNLEQKIRKNERNAELLRRILLGEETFAMEKNEFRADRLADAGAE